MPTLNLGRIGFVNKGTYSATAAYKINDVVVSATGGTYACVQAGTGFAVTNTAYWQMWVADTYQPLDATLTALAAVDATPGAVYQTGADTFAKVGGAFGHRNKIINGNFGVNQRAVSGTVTLAAGVYGHDRWKAGADGCTYTFATSKNVTTITISAGTLRQVIEGTNLLSGTHVLTWTGTATARVDAGAYGATGLTGTAVGGTNQAIEFATGTVSKVQYEPGSVATPFGQRPIGTELALCLRYCYAPARMSGGQYLTTASTFWVDLPVTMRAAPTSSLALTVLKVVGVGDAAGLGTLTLGDSTTGYFRAFVTHTAISALGNPVQANVTGVLAAEL